MNIEKLSKEEIMLTINHLSRGHKEIKEAIEAGVAVKVSLSRLMEKLNSARGWGIWDIFGGKLIANMGKHFAIEAANKISDEVKDNLRRFEKELNDINRSMDLAINLSGFATFADFFFDGLIADFYVQGKINNARKNAQGAQESVDEILSKLEVDLDRVKNLLKELENKNEV